MKIDDLDIAVGAEYKVFGLKDDGHEYIGDVFYVQVTDKDGNRWHLNRAFPGVRVERDEETGYNHFMDIRPWAKSITESIVRRIRLRKRIDLQHWVPARPEYGSLAYVQYGSFDDLMAERYEG